MEKSLLTGNSGAGSPGNGESRINRLIRRAACFGKRIINIVLRIEAHTSVKQGITLTDTVVNKRKCYMTVLPLMRFMKLTRRFPSDQGQFTMMRI